MPIGHPVFWILLCAVLAPLLAEIPLRFKVPVVVIEVLLVFSLMVSGPSGAVNPVSVMAIVNEPVVCGLPFSVIVIRAKGLKV